ncbi:MAG: hypothetical protein JXN65_03970 [Clostridia bacterium]|nr:hypothetical protein [Clostridia bacterium]
MFKFIHIKSELKKIFREPIMVLLFFAPILITLIFKLMYVFLVPFIQKYIAFDMSQYQHYVLVFTMIMSAMLLSIVMGFTMIDDRDNKIVELISVTPMGKSGYLFMRLSLVFLFVFIYSIYTYLFMGIYILPVFTLLYLSLILCIYSAVMGLLLFSVASDKVNGLTYAKGMNVVFLFAFVDLLNIKWLNAVGGIFPPYWITKIIASPTNIYPLIMGAVVPIIWFLIVLKRSKI